MKILQNIVRNGIAVFLLGGMLVGSLASAQVLTSLNVDRYEFLRAGTDPNGQFDEYRRTYGVLFADGSFTPSFSTETVGSFGPLEGKFVIDASLWDQMESNSPGSMSTNFTRSSELIQIDKGAGSVDFFYSVSARASAPSFARPEGWMWTQGEWEWSNNGRYWYWIPPGPPSVLNTTTNQVVARPINGWNFYAWPYFWNADEGVWYYIFQGNLPFVLNPTTNQWRRWGD